MVEKILEKNKNILIQIPQKIVKHVGLQAGGCVEVTDDGYHIILTPIEEEFTDKEWQKIIDLKKEKRKQYKSGEALIKELKGLMNK